MFLPLSSPYLVLDYLGFFPVGSRTCANDSRGKERVVRTIVSFSKATATFPILCAKHTKNQNGTVKSFWNSKKFLKSQLLIRKK